MYRFEGFIDTYFKYHKYAMKYEDFQTNLEEFFSNKQKILEVMGKNKVLWMFGVGVFLLLVVFVLQGVLIGRVQVAKASNTVIKDDMTRLIQFYHDLGNIGMFIERFAFTVQKGVTYYYEYYKLQDLCLSLQGLNEYLDKFDKK